MAYYVEGTEENPTKYKLVLSIHDFSTVDRAKYELIRVAEALSQRVFTMQLPKAICQAIDDERDLKLPTEMVTLDFICERFNGGKMLELKLSFLKEVNNVSK